MLFQKVTGCRKQFLFYFSKWLLELKKWRVSFSRVFFSLYLVFYPFLPLPANTKRHGEKKKGQNQNPHIIFLFPTTFWILKKMGKNSILPQIEITIISFQQINVISKEQAERLEGWAAAQGLGIWITVSGENWMAQYNSHSEYCKREWYSLSFSLSE